MNYGLNVTGKVRVFRKDKEVTGANRKKYTINDVWFNTSEKNDDGTYFNVATNLIFKRGLDIPNHNTVIILEGFPMISGNGDWRKVVYYITNWSYEG